MDGDKEEVASDVADCLRTVEKDGSKADNNLSGNCFDLDSIFFFLQKMIHFCKLTFSGDVKNCIIRLIKGKNRKDDLQLTILKITYIFITYINILSLERSRLKI